MPKPPVPPTTATLTRPPLQHGLGEPARGARGRSSACRVTTAATSGASARRVGARRSRARRSGPRNSRRRAPGVVPPAMRAEHTVERALDGAAADQRADGDARGRCARSSASRIPATARIGWIETYGLLGATTIASASRIASRTPGRGPRGLGAVEHASRRPRPRAGGRRTTPGTANVPAGVTTSVRSAVVGRRQQPRREARRLGERAVTAESGSPSRSACVRTRCSPMSRSPSLNQPSPPHASRPTRAPARSRRRGPSRAPRRSARRARRARESRSGETCRPSTSTSSPTLPTTVSSPGAERRRAGRARAWRRRRRRRGSTTFTRDRVDELRVMQRAPPRVPSRDEVGERVDVVDELRERQRLGVEAEPAAWRETARRCPGRRAARNQARSGSASAFVVPSRASTSASRRAAASTRERVPVRRARAGRR